MSGSIGPNLFKRLLSIKAMPTPNANALKFISDHKLLPFNKTVEFSNTLSAIHSPLALRILKLEGVRSIMLGQDFLTVNKDDFTNWAHLRPEVIEVLTKQIENNEPIITKEFIKNQEKEDAIANEEEDDEVNSMIKELIDTRIRPAIQDDGGDIDFRGFDKETGTVFLKLQGACKSCSSSEDTLKHGIESMLMHYIDEVKIVEQILDPEEEIALKEFEKLEKSLSSKADVPPPSL